MAKGTGYAVESFRLDRNDWSEDWYRFYWQAWLSAFALKCNGKLVDIIDKKRDRAVATFLSYRYEYLIGEGRHE